MPLFQNLVNCQLLLGKCARSNRVYEFAGKGQPGDVIDIEDADVGNPWVKRALDEKMIAPVVVEKEVKVVKAAGPEEVKAAGPEEVKAVAPEEKKADPRKQEPKKQDQKKVEKQEPVDPPAPDLTKGITGGVAPVEGAAK